MLLVCRICNSQHYPGPTLRDHCALYIGGPLADEHQSDAILSTFTSDSPYSSLRSCILCFASIGNISVSFLANQDEASPKGGLPLRLAIQRCLRCGCLGLLLSRFHLHQQIVQLFRQVTDSYLSIPTSENQSSGRAAKPTTYLEST